MLEVIESKNRRYKAAFRPYQERVQQGASAPWYMACVVFLALRTLVVGSDRSRIPRQGSHAHQWVYDHLPACRWSNGIDMCHEGILPWLRIPVVHILGSIRILDIFPAVVASQVYRCEHAVAFHGECCAYYIIIYGNMPFLRKPYRQGV